MSEITSEEWYVNTKTGEITQGLKPAWEHRLGPYPSQEAAAEWRGTVAARNLEADDVDLEWEETID